MRQVAAPESLMGLVGKVRIKGQSMKDRAKAFQLYPVAKDRESVGGFKKQSGPSPVRLSG